MNAAFFGLAGLAALNPKLLVIDLILAGNRRPRPMFVCFLLGGMGMGLAVGLADVLVLHIGAIKIQNHASGGLDLALGIVLGVNLEDDTVEQGVALRFQPRVETAAGLTRGLGPAESREQHRELAAADSAGTSPGAARALRRVAHRMSRLLTGPLPCGLSVVPPAGRA